MAMPSLAPLPSPEQLKTVFECDPERGELRWINRPGVVGNSRVAGKLAGAVAKNGYRVVTIRPHWMHVHRVVWAMVYGEWPDQHVDHINGNKLDNRICNLRLATRSQNLSNRGAQANSRSGVKGVFVEAWSGRWKASIQHQGRTFNLGRYDTREQAQEAYRRAAEHYHGEFARTT